MLHNRLVYWYSIGMIAEWSEYCALLDAVGRMCIIRKST